MRKSIDSDEGGHMACTEVVRIILVHLGLKLQGLTDDMFLRQVSVSVSMSTARPEQWSVPYGS